MKVLERPVVFECEGVQLIGIVHIPERPQGAGLLAVAAGGIQYRAGCGRQLLSLARALASQGTPVMRFDNRGMGDSGGELLGFQHIDADLRSAIEMFRECVPELRHVVLFGGCEAASGIMISAPLLTTVKGLILANPWVIDSKHAVVSGRHYYRRLRDIQFWKKLIRFQYNPLEYVSGMYSYAKEKIEGTLSRSKASPGEMTGQAVPFQSRMLSGFQKFDGPVLFLKSGLSLISEEFDHLVENSKPWREAQNRVGIQRVELPCADQTFSTAAARKEMCEAVVAWVSSINKMHAPDERR
jgi:uncharacterized protein